MNPSLGIDSRHFLQASDRIVYPVCRSDGRKYKSLILFIYVFVSGYNSNILDVHKGYTVPGTYVPYDYDMYIPVSFQKFGRAKFFPT